MANPRFNKQVAQPRVSRKGGGMGGRSGDMMYARGQGVNMRSKRVPTELMDRGAMKKGGKVIKPKGPGVLRPKPTDRYGQQMKPKPMKPGKKDGGMLKAVPADNKGLKKLPTQVRNKMGYMKKGGRVNTKRMNRLEELGRVDAEKAKTSKGKRNLKQEKKRIVRELKK